MPGAATWKEHHALLLQGLKVYLWREPDGGGDALVGLVSADLPDLYLIEAPREAKDPSELHLLDPQGFKTRLDALIAAARPLSQLRAEAFSAETRESLKLALPLLEAPDFFDAPKALLQRLGYAGDPRPAVMAYVALVSRLLKWPLKLAYISQSAAGKNAAFEVVLPLFPASAYHLVRASSPRALIYNNEEFSYRVVIVSEADSLPEDGPAASALRSLMSDGAMIYEVVERGDDGKFAVRRIVKPGPTGLITSSTKALGEQASTRMLTVSLPDSPDQTRLIMQAQAARLNEEAAPPDLAPWAVLQRWLELAGERQVVVPFAARLADLLPADAVRLRRDFMQLLVVIQAVALLAPAPPPVRRPGPGGGDH